MMSDRKQKILAHLSENRAVLNAVLDQLTPEQWETSIQDGDEHWTPHNLLAHLFDAERGMVGQATRIAAGETPIPPDFDLDRWNRRAVKKMSDQTVADLRRSLAETRAAAVQAIEALPEAGLDVIGRHSSLQMLSVEAIFRLIGSHEHDHTAIIAAAFKLPISASA